MAKRNVLIVTGIAIFFTSLYCGSYLYYRMQHDLIHRQTTEGSWIILGDINSAVFMMAADPIEAQESHEKWRSFLMVFYAPLRHMEAANHNSFTAPYVH